MDTNGTLAPAGDTLKRLEPIAKLPDTEKQQLLQVVDALLSDFNAKKAYAL
jgi:hypothetical protein